MTDRLILDPQAECWQRAVSRALANGGIQAVTPLWLTNDQYGVEALYAVESATSDGVTYDVHLVDDADVSLTCSCPAGAHGVVCWHVAGVALYSRHMADPQALTALKKLGHNDEPTPTAGSPVPTAPRPLRSADFDFDDILSGKYAEALTSGALGS